MSSPFDDLDALCQGATDASFGEDIRIEPIRRTDYSITADPDRAIKTVRAVVSISGGSESIQGQARGTEFKGVTRFASAPAEAWLTAAALAGVGYALASGDRVVLESRPGAPAYSITQPVPLDDGGVQLLLAVGG